MKYLTLLSVGTAGRGAPIHTLLNLNIRRAQRLRALADREGLYTLIGDMRTWTDAWPSTRIWTPPATGVDDLEWLDQILH